MCIRDSIICSSYLFILQPHYQPDQDEIVTDENAVNLGDLSGYIVEHSDGRYSFIDGYGNSVPIKNETAKQFISDGYEVKKE